MANAARARQSREMLDRQQKDRARDEWARTFAEKLVAMKERVGPMDPPRYAFSVEELVTIINLLRMDT